MCEWRPGCEIRSGDTGGGYVTVEGVGAGVGMLRAAMPGDACVALRTRSSVFSAYFISCVACGLLTCQSAYVPKCPPTYRSTQLSSCVAMHYLHCLCYLRAFAQAWRWLGPAAQAPELKQRPPAHSHGVRDRSSHALHALSPRSKCVNHALLDAWAPW
eukprot:6208220-Pleurochrysis_carterae.AAC.2